jgi:hypothetical protein
LRFEQGRLAAAVPGWSFDGEGEADRGGQPVE